MNSSFNVCNMSARIFLNFGSALRLVLHLLAACWIINFHGQTVIAQWIDYPPSGTATMTHYEMPLDFVASCGCVPASTHYPTAAMSQMAYGSSTAFGPACGRCFKLTLVAPVTASPPFFPSVVKSVVVKVTDLCPLSQNGWCSGTASKPNAAGQYINFDLVYPSSAIPDDFFPSNVTLYGYTDFGVWNVTYESVSCVSDWEGGQDSTALGSVTSLGPEGACCPSNPTTQANDTCVSYSDKNAISPTFSANSAGRRAPLPFTMWTTLFIAIIYNT